MKLGLIPLCLAALAYATCEDYAEGSISIKTEKNLKHVIKVNPIFFMIVSADWCTHCCSHEKTFKKYRERLEVSGVNTLRVDLTKHDFVRKWIEDTDTLPQGYFVKGGHYYRVSLDTKPKDIVELSQKIMHPAEELATVDAVNAFMGEPGIRVLGVFFEDDRDRESEYYRFVQTMVYLLNWSDTKTGVVTDPATIKTLRG
jgi:hypothetical protein